MKKSMKKSITSAITSGQRDRIVQFGSDAIKKVLRELAPNKLGAQHIIERGDEFVAVICKATLTSLNDLLVTDKFKNEEVPSKYGYLSGYKKPVEIKDQIDILRSHWPSLDPDPALRYIRELYPMLQLPGWVEGPFAIIRPGFFSDKYGEELEEVLKALAKDRNGKFHNYREGQLGPKYLRQSKQTLFKMRTLVKQQPGSDILISSAQFGIHHGGRSVRRAFEVFVDGEYGTGAKNVGTMLLTNPIRLMHYNDLWIDCAGDEFSPVGVGVFSGAPYFFFYVDQLKFAASFVGRVDTRFGSVSAFLSPEG